MTKNDDTEHHEGSNHIHSYMRRQAIEASVLVDVTETAREAGFSASGGAHASGSR